ncbi:hypothetical protein A0J48_021890 [Sphaerospermopsis aphanizomenoides BCCUSP55]|uniref:type IV pilin-like G/H family protein n=1 Tax=Sphaerospermopsis aphanizomenoides TaxID=459663 RepID=UPI0019089595|nr:type IV pilin-like G/H family protein [Sphaerospermopsis aphanizomenoides]MBK1990144.1 hypothetical protein [Sphaerospermopsis aphanizomenoides BCCUSP55]
MQDNLYTKPYSTLILERLGRGFSEAETIDILRQVLPQLAQIHLQGLAHGAISSDTLAQNQSNLQTVLLNSPGFAHPSYAAPEQLHTGQISTSGDIYALGVTMIVLLTGKSPELLRNYDGTWNWQDDCFVSDQLAGILEQAIAIQPQYRYPDAMQMLSAINSVFTPATQPQDVSVKNISSSVPAYQPTYSVATNSQQNSKFTQLQLILISSGVTIVICLVGFGLLQFLNSRQNIQTVTESSTPSSTTENTPNTTNSDVSDPIPNSSTTTSENKLDQVLPTYIPSAFSPSNAFATCPETTKLYLIGETEQFRFAVCGANGRSLYYFGYDKNSGSSIKLSGSDSGFWNGNYLYLPPSYQDTNYTNAILRVYQNNNLIASRPLINLYKLSENNSNNQSVNTSANNSSINSDSIIGWGLLNQAKKARQAEGKTYVGSMNRGEQAYYVENNQFTADVEKLGIGINTETENYSYRINILSNTAVQTIGVAKKAELTNFSGGVFVTSNKSTVAILCQTETPSATTPPAPQLINDQPECPPGTINLSRN